MFGFLEPCRLYGGRIYTGPQLENDFDINLRLPLTNHYVTKEDYDQSREFLEKYHKSGNAVIVVNDDLAKWIKQDFTLYEVEASCIKNIDSLKKISKLPKYYDSLVLPAKCNNDKDLLNNISDKSVVRLFLNAGCAYTCPSRICYKSISKVNQGEGSFKCSQSIKPRHKKGFVEFDMVPGFHRYKILTQRGMTGA